MEDILSWMSEPIALWFGFSLLTKKPFKILSSTIYISLLLMSELFNDYFNQIFSMIYMILLIPLTVSYIYFLDRKLNFNQIVKVVIGFILLLLSDYITFLFFTIISSKHLIFDSIIPTLISKILFIILCTFYSKFNFSVSNKKIAIKVLSTLILGTIFITCSLQYTIFNNLQLSHLSGIACLFILLFLNFNFFKEFEALNKNIKTTQSELELINKINELSSDVSKREHQLTYILSNLKSKITDESLRNDFEAYLNSINNDNQIVLSKNPILDNYLTHELNEFISNGLILTPRIEIEKHKYYQSEELLNILSNILIFTKENAYYQNPIKLSLIEKSDYLIITVSFNSKTNDEIDLTKNLKQFLDKIRLKYKTSYEDNIFTLKVLINVYEKEK